MSDICSYLFFLSKKQGNNISPIIGSSNKNIRAFEEIISRWPILPVPIIPSKLYLLFEGDQEGEDQSYRCNATVNAFQVLRAMIAAESEVVRIIKHVSCSTESSSIIIR